MSIPRISLSLFAIAAGLSTLAYATDIPNASPTCCAKHAYCCKIKAKCCDRSAEAEIIPLAFVADQATKPTCCDKRAYCCTIKSPCCGKTLVVEVASIPKEKTGKGDDTTTSPTCCAKRAYCCTVKATCCGKEAKAEFVSMEGDKIDQASTSGKAIAKDTAFVASAIEKELPTCCAKHAYCCTVKSPCCGKAVDLAIVR